MPTGKYKKLKLNGSKSDIALYVGPRVHQSWKVVAERLDAFEGGHLINVIEAAVEQGKRLGRAEVMKQVDDLRRLFGKEIAAIEKTTIYKTPGRPRKKPLTIEK
jgi:hypothetical protein